MHMLNVMFSLFDAIFSSLVSVDLEQQQIDHDIPAYKCSSCDVVTLDQFAFIDGFSER